MDEGIAAAARVRDIFDDVVARGFRAQAVQGASDREIDTWAAAQGVRMVPAALREILRIMGKPRRKTPTGWFESSAFGVDSIDARDKEFAGWCVEEADERGIEHGMRDPEGMLVVAGDGTSASFVVIDGSDLAEPDPPIWVLTEAGSIRRSSESTTAWFAKIGEELMDLTRQHARRRGQAYYDVP
ncbi:hypothetical protein [Amycolatopsis sp. YIM 10]|uniref:hypothetical protein n=1 Tax=Amycolatopsis sp. YIM 10 TaxID=2653857 RepID=UPI00129070B5|nr:hypothetical protein [Amycolatopsis sp. YIM 10]